MTDNTVYGREQEAKRKAVAGLEPGKQCGPDNLDERVNPEIDPSVAASYPSRDKTAYPYNYETPTHKINVQFADGHHGPDRWDIQQNDPGTPDKASHEHDDYKRPPPSTQDAELDPKQFRVGLFANYRVPDSLDVLSVPGDKLGPSTEQRAKKPKNQLTDNSLPRQVSGQ